MVRIVIGWLIIKVIYKMVVDIIVICFIVLRLRVMQMLSKEQLEKWIVEIRNIVSEMKWLLVEYGQVVFNDVEVLEELLLLCE